MSTKYWDKDICNRSKQIFNTTENFAEAGYILPDGSMLRFTNDDNPGVRCYSHRAIGIVYGECTDIDINDGTDSDGYSYVERFVESGAMRLDSGDLDLNLNTGIQISKSTPMTLKQEKRLKEFIEWKHNREKCYVPNDFSKYRILTFIVEFGGDSEYAIGDISKSDLDAWNIDYLYYEGNDITSDRIINDIRQYYTGDSK